MCSKKRHVHIYDRKVDYLRSLRQKSEKKRRNDSVYFLTLVIPNSQTN